MTLRRGELDVIVVWTPDKPEVDVRHHWTEDMVWGKSPNLVLDPAQPVPLVSRGSEWLNHQLAVAALERAGRRYEVVLPELPEPPSSLAGTVAVCDDGGSDTVTG